MLNENAQTDIVEKSLLVFEKYTRSNATRKMYRYLFVRFLNWTKINDVDGILQLKESYLQQLVEDYILYMRKQILPNSFQPIVASLELFFSMNDKTLNWKKIRKMIPSPVKKSGYNAWQTKDIEKMLQLTTSLRNKALLHFLASTACRIGAISELKIKHLSDMPDNCKSVLFYEGTNEEYDGFLTPEASQIINEYLNKRRKDGEYLNDESPLFRASYQVGVQKAKPLSLNSITQILHRLVKQIDTRKRIGNRFNVMMAHGFRKRFATIIKLDNKISWSVGERLLGHKTYLEREYFRPVKNELFTEFKKIMPDLIIDQSEKLRVEAHLKDEQMRRIESQKDGLIQQLQEQIKENEKTKTSVQKILNHLKLAC
ncbi:MAG: site-specific integrase [Nitrosotalea sp.]